MPQHLNVQSMRIGAQFDYADEVAMWIVVSCDARGRPPVGFPQVRLRTTGTWIWALQAAMHIATRA
jgi:hypothetical protein